MWVLDYWSDLDADFLRFYRIDLTVDAVESSRFFALAYRLPSYKGALTARLLEEWENEKKANPTARAMSKNPGAEFKDISELNI